MAARGRAPQRARGRWSVTWRGRRRSPGAVIGAGETAEDYNAQVGVGGGSLERSPKPMRGMAVQR